MLLLLGWFLPATVTTATGVIGTREAWNGTSTFGTLLGGRWPDSEEVVATYGQTFRPPSDGVMLERFSIWLSDSPIFDPAPLTFGAYLLEWGGTRATGPVRYASGPVSTGFMPHGSWSEFRFDDLHVPLQPNRTYVFILSASRYLDGLDRTAYVGSVPADAYAEGSFVSQDNHGDDSSWTAERWFVSPESWDLAFEAQFVPVPEPSQLGLLALGAGALGWRRARRRSRQLPTVP